MNISATVSILILTVFLSIAAPVYAAEDPTLPPYIVQGCVKYTDGTPAADSELVLLYEEGDPLNNTTVPVGSYSVGCWKANLNEIPGDLTDGDIIVVKVRDNSTTLVVDFSHEDIMEGRTADTLIIPLSVSAAPPATNGGSDANDGSGGSDGTYPEPTPTSTTTPTAASSEPTVEPTVETTGATTDAPTATQTKITAEFKTQSTPGFGAVSTVFAIAGLLVVTYLVMRRRE